MLVNVLMVFSSCGTPGLPFFFSPLLACSTTCLSCWHQLSRGDWQACWLAFTSRVKMSHTAASLVCVPGSHPSPANAQQCHRLPRAVNIHLGVSIPPPLLPQPLRALHWYLAIKPKCYLFQFSTLVKVYTGLLQQGVWFHYSLPSES